MVQVELQLQRQTNIKSYDIDRRHFQNFNGPNCPITQISRSRQYSTLNILGTVEYRDIVTMEDE